MTLVENVQIGILKIKLEKSGVCENQSGNICVIGSVIEKCSAPRRDVQHNEISH